MAADMAQDAASNGNTAATQFSITYDTMAPTVTLTSTATGTYQHLAHTDDGYLQRERDRLCGG